MIPVVRMLPLSLVAAVALVVGVPVAGLPGSGPDPRPVEVGLRSVAIPVTPSGAGATGVLERSETAPYSMVAVSWAQSSALRVAVEVRTRQESVWGPWTALGEGDAFADGGTDDTASTRSATSPLWVGESTGIQVRASSSQGRPKDLRVDLIDPGASPADVTLGESAAPLSPAAAADDGRPAIITRAEWGADESIRLAECPDGPTYTGAPKVGFVHHTASGNTYTADTAAAAVRGIYAYSVGTRGYCDIPYNFLVDKYGRIFEGRFGGIDASVLSAATGGFNTDTFAVSALGTYSTVTPSAAQVDAIGTMVGWKLGRYGVNPLATARADRGWRVGHHGQVRRRDHGGAARRLRPPAGGGDRMPGQHPVPVPRPDPAAGRRSGIRDPAQAAAHVAALVRGGAVRRLPGPPRRTRGVGLLG